jgi:hypothetical protein
LIFSTKDVGEAGFVREMEEPKPKADKAGKIREPQTHFDASLFLDFFGSVLLCKRITIAGDV